jgi:4-hydroxy-4-methyl-2-oxoglutarate aldolase
MANNNAAPGGPDFAESNADSLRRLDACAVSDAVDRLGLAAAVGGISSLTVRRKITGQVTTVRLGLPDAGASNPLQPARHLGTTAVVDSLPGMVVVVEQRTGVEAAGWGGILTRSAVRAGLAGVICEGWVRDVDEAIDLSFPIYARGATARTARGRVIEVGTNVPVTVGDVVVHPGDWVIADSSGIAFIPADHLTAVIAMAQTIVAREEEMVRAIAIGRPVTEVMGATYEQLLERNRE